MEMIARWAASASPNFAAASESEVNTDSNIRWTDQEGGSDKAASPRSSVRGFGFRGKYRKFASAPLPSPWIDQPYNQRTYYARTIYFISGACLRDRRFAPDGGALAILAGDRSSARLDPG